MQKIKHWEILIGLFAFFVFTAISFLFRHQGLSFFDTSDFASFIQGPGLPHAPGYPIYLILGKAINVFTQDPFLAQFWINILSLAGVSFFLFRTFFEHQQVALLLLLFLFAQTYLQQYILIPEVFTLNLLFASAIIYFHQRLAQSGGISWVVGIGFFYGLAVGHQHLLALMVPTSAYLIVREFRSGRIAAITLGFSSAFLIGLLPLYYLFWTSDLNPDYTYYSVHSWEDFFFVLFRRGYGTFKMTASGAAIPMLELGGQLLKGLLFGSALVGLILGLGSFAKWWPELKKGTPELVLSVGTFLISFIVFLLQANFPNDVEGQNAFRRMLIFPSFLLLYPLGFAFKALLAQKSSIRFNLLAITAVGLSALSFSQLNYRHYPVLEFHLQNSFQRILAEVNGPADKEIDPRYKKCVIFTVADPLHFGGRYYNQYRTQERCYFLSIGSVVVRQFQSQAEQKLIAKYFPNGWDPKLKRSDLMYSILQTFMLNGYRVFFLYSGDVHIFEGKNPLLQPVGGVLEMVTGQVPVSAMWMQQNYRDYLLGLQPLLSELERSWSLPRTMSEPSLWAPFSNLLLYKKVTQVPQDLVELEAKTLKRLELLVKEELK